jgi:hypothetical protein
MIKGFNINGNIEKVDYESLENKPSYTATEIDEKLGKIDTILPEITTNDNGKVLGVVDGAWVATDSGSDATGITVVDTANDLPTDAKQDDIVFVENEAFVKRVEQTEEVPIVIQAQEGEQASNFELRQDAIYLSDINLTEKHPELADKNASISVSYSLENSENEIDVQYVYFPASMMSAEFGVNHSLDFYTFATFNLDESMTQWIKLRGMSVKDYFTMLMEFSGTEEELQTLFGEHYTDESIDNPSYGWIKLYATAEPINENSIEIDGMYATVEFDAVADFKTTCVLDGFMIETYDSNGEQDIYIDTGFVDPEDYESEELITALGYANTFVNLLFNGGVKDNSYDVYSKKGFYIYKDGKWTSLEEDMNIPKVVDTYSDLPKSFIENGLMVVANDEEILPEPTTKLDSSIPVSVKVNPTPSVQGEVEKLKQYFIQNGASSDVDWDNCNVYLGGEFYNENDNFIGVFSIDKATENNVYTILLDLKKNTDDTSYYISYYYFDEAGAEIYIPPIDSSSDGTIYTVDEGGCWYCMEHYVGDKDNILKSQPQKVKLEDWFNLLDINVYCDYMWCGYEDDNDNYDELEPISYEFANMFKIYDNSKILIRPKGFYQYVDNCWWHQPEIAGESFDNADVLRAITAEDVGNIQLNTEKSHEHTNKAQLDQIDAYFLQRTYDSNSIAHRHTNLNVLNSITNDEISVINSLGMYNDGISSFLTYDGSLVNNTYGYSIEQVFTEEQTIRPKSFYTYVPQEGTNTLAIKLYCAADHPIGISTGITEFMFAVDTRKLSENIRLECSLSKSSWSALKDFTLEWVGEPPIVLYPNRYYEFSIFNCKGIWVSSEIGGV